jgi:regulator of RNase E activity RraB
MFYHLIFRGKTMVKHYCINTPNSTQFDMGNTILIFSRISDKQGDSLDCQRNPLIYIVIRLGGKMEGWGCWWWWGIGHDFMGFEWLNIWGKIRQFFGG